MFKDINDCHHEINFWQKCTKNLLESISRTNPIKLVKADFENIDDDVKDVVCPESKTWEEFKNNAESVLSDRFGFTATRGTGPFGTVILSQLNIPAFIGENLAHILHSQGQTYGNAKSNFYKFISKELYKKIKFIKLHIDISFSDFRSGFSSVERDGKTYGFRTSGWQFNRKTVTLSYKSGASQDESELERLLTHQYSHFLTSVFRELWNIEADYGNSRVECLANDSSTKAGKLQNIDIAIVAKQWRISQDELKMAAIELKANNALTSLFTALSQAASYQALANEVWIVAPGLKQENFNDLTQYHNFYVQCRDNGFGIIHLELFNNEKKVSNIEVVLRARSSPIVRTSLQRRVLSELGWNYCVKCARLYTLTTRDEEESSEAENSVLDCGWQIENECARELEERLLMRAKQGNSPHTGEQQR